MRYKCVIDYRDLIQLILNIFLSIAKRDELIPSQHPRNTSCAPPNNGSQTYDTRQMVSLDFEGLFCIESEDEDAKVERKKIVLVKGQGGDAFTTVGKSRASWILQINLFNASWCIYRVFEHRGSFCIEPIRHGLVSMRIFFLHPITRGYWHA